MSLTSIISFIIESLDYLCRPTDSYGCLVLQAHYNNKSYPNPALYRDAEMIPSLQHVSKVDCVMLRIASSYPALIVFHEKDSPG